MRAGELPPATIGEVFAGAEPDAEALVTRSGRFTYAELDAAADRAAHAWWALGVRPGDRVGVSLPNDTDIVVSFHGAMRLGAVWVGVNRNLAAPEKAYLLADSAAVLVLTDTPFDAGVRVVLDGDEWAAALRDAPAIELPTIDPDAAAGIAYTSGTTGRPKGAVHSQRTLLAPAAALVASRGYDENLRKADCLPLTILNMQVLTSLLVPQAGGCSVIMDRIDAEGVAEWIRREHPTTWNGPPALLHSLVERDDIPAADFNTVSRCRCPSCLHGAAFPRAPPTGIRWRRRRPFVDRPVRAPAPAPCTRAFLLSVPRV